MKVQQFNKTEERNDTHNSKANTKCNVTICIEVKKIKLGKYDFMSKRSWTFR